MLIRVWLRSCHISLFWGGRQHCGKFDGCRVTALVCEQVMIGDLSTVHERVLFGNPCTEGALFGSDFDCSGTVLRSRRFLSPPPSKLHMMYNLGVPAGVTTRPWLGSEFGSPDVTQTPMLSGSGVSGHAPCLRSKSRFCFVLKPLPFYGSLPGFRCYSTCGRSVLTFLPISSSHGESLHTCSWAMPSEGHWSPSIVSLQFALCARLACCFEQSRGYLSHDRSCTWCWILGILLRLTLVHCHWSAFPEFRALQTLASSLQWLEMMCLISLWWLPGK